jgi:chromosome segregation ATPase
MADAPSHLPASPGLTPRPERQGPEVDARLREIQAREQKLQEAIQELETDRVIWYQRRQEMENEETQLQTACKEYEGKVVRLDRWETRLGLKESQLAEREKKLAGQRGPAHNEERPGPQIDIEANKELERIRGELGAERRRLDEDRRESLRHLNSQLAECQAREEELADAWSGFEKKRLEHRAEEERLTALATTLEARERECRVKVQTLDERYEQMQKDSAELEDQSQEVAAWQERLTAEAARLEHLQTTLVPRARDIDARQAALDEGWTSLTAARAELQQTRQDANALEERLRQERLRLEEDQTRTREEREDLDRIRQELEEADRIRQEEESHLAEESRQLTESVTELHRLKDELDRQKATLAAQQADFVQKSQRIEEECNAAKAKSLQLAELHERYEADRQALLMRSAGLAEAEQARTALQEQLRKRSEQLTQQQKELAEREARLTTASATMDLERRTHTQQSAEFAVRKNEISESETTLLRHYEHLRDTGRMMAAQRKLLHQARCQFVNEQKAAQQAAADRLIAFQQVQKQIAELDKQLPDLEVPAESAMTHFTDLRAQLREHLTQLHAYAQQSHADLETLRRDVLADAEQTRQQQSALARARQEHRAAVATFRQQLIDWQGQVGQLKRSLKRDESQIEKREAAIEQTATRLARQAESLEVQEREVQVRRSEIEHHLDDMRQWYRAKLRELTGQSAVAIEEAFSGGTKPPDKPEANLDEMEASDVKLGEWLRSLGLVESDTLTALLTEARRQRQSLRQLLLAGGYLTLYQLALIEAGNLDGLMLGPVRIMDRLRVTALEAIYRVFDPRRSGGSPTASQGYVILRHLADAEMKKIGHPAEFRESFEKAATIHHENVISTYEVLDIKNRPAVIQELVTGLPASDWPALVANPDVWLALVRQAAEGLAAVHQAGLVHGRLAPGTCILTPDGILKLMTVGEPSWLAADAASATEPAPDAASDLKALHEMAAQWSRLSAGARKSRKGAVPNFPAYANAQELLQALDGVNATRQPDCQAWKQLLAHVTDHITPPAVRKSA